VVRLRASGSCAGRRQVAIALSAVVDGDVGINVIGCDRSTVPVSGASLPLALGATA